MFNFCLFRLAIDYNLVYKMLIYYLGYIKTETCAIPQKLQLFHINLKADVKHLSSKLFAYL